MKKYLFTLSLFVMAFASCKKDTTANTNAAAQATADDAAIQAYLTANPNIKATKDASGLYYQVLTQGTGANPAAGATVTVNYVGKLLSGTQFEQRSGFKTNLSAVIPGWQIGVPYVKTGGRILLIIPSGLAYGTSSPDAGIPANSILVYTIDLLSIP